jgi:hypothetical protein
MKTVTSVAVLVIMPLGFFVLAAVIVNRMLAKRRLQLSSRTLRATGTEPSAKVQ